ncbi:MAG TPA: dipeptide/oligopeptide/nickel ABC transporter ATP-binding protein [Galbitalea sp.]|nr:dipeptide/oligopeptide/nickel ABC transporter ATP-binding protein [Galbitalea sp.]
MSSDPVAPSLESPGRDTAAEPRSVATATRPLAVHADDLSLKFPGGRSSSRHQAVDGVTFAIPQGEILALIGESGSGKSALARAVAGLAGTGGPNPIITGGSLTVLGRPVREISQRKRDRLQLGIGYVPQDAGAALDARLTVGENVAEPIYSRDPNFDQLEAGIAVATVIDAVRLPLTTMNSYPHELSRGQRQRVAIARALILEPSLLVADDPTAGIDVTVRGTILDIISELHKDRSFSALIVSHTVNEVRRFGDRVAVLHRGVIVGIGGVDEVLDAPQHEYVSGLARALADLKAAEVLSVD